jgi:hypothetical protein
MFYVNRSSIIELQSYINWMNEMQVEVMMNSKHAPHAGISCEEYERLIAQAKTEP